MASSHHAHEYIKVARRIAGRMSTLKIDVDETASIRMFDTDGPEGAFVQCWLYVPDSTITRIKGDKNA